MLQFKQLLPDGGQGYKGPVQQLEQDDQQRKHFVPWLTNETRDMMIQRDKFKEQAKALAISEGRNSSSEQTEMWRGYKRLRNKVSNRIKQEETHFKKGKVAECQGCPSKVCMVTCQEVHGVGLSRASHPTGG